MGSPDDALTQTIPWRVFLRDPDQRVSLIDDILSQARLDDIRAVDRAVVAVLHHVGLPRGPHVRGPFVEAVGHGWAGRKAPDCRLLIDIEAFHDLAGVLRADSLLRTWIHESLHGRRPYTPGFAEEWRLYRGFEEGMVEGLARIIASQLDLRPVLASYGYYVSAYQTLATALAIPVEEIWRSLWKYPAGEVSGRFGSSVEDVMASYGRPALSAVHHIRLFARARTVFGTSNNVQSPDEHVLLRGCQEVLR